MVDINSFIMKDDTRAVVSSVGGTVKQFIVKGRDIFYPWKIIDGKERGGLPICAPWFGLSTRASKKHGFLRDSEAIDFFARESVANALFVNGSTGYPWSLRYDVTVNCNDRELALLLAIRNSSGLLEKAPICPGFHPYFACKKSSRAVVAVEGKEYGNFSAKSQMISLESRKIMVHVPDESILITMNLSESFFKFGNPQMNLWTDSEDYFCVEPILYPYNLFDTSQGFYLEAGEEINLGITFHVV